MARYLRTLALHLAINAAVVALVLWAASRIFGETPPAGLIGMLAGIGIVGALARARRELPPAKEGGE